MDSHSDLDNNAIDLLEAKVARLESLVYGEGDKTYDKPATMIECLLAANNMLSAAANSRKNIESVYRRLGELNRDITDDALGDPASEFERKLNVVLTLHGQYKHNASVLENVSRLHFALDKGNLKSLDELRPELAKLVDKYSALRRAMDEGESDEELAAAWHDVVMEVTKGLVAANNAVTDLEQHQGIK